MERRKRLKAASEVVGRQVGAARELLRPRVSQTELSQRLATLGVDMDQSAIARLEAGERRITVDEVFALAAALGVSPLYLMSGDFTNEDVPVTPTIERTPFGMRHWLRGDLALSDVDRETYFELVPDEERLARQWRGLMNLRAI